MLYAVLMAKHDRDKEGGAKDAIYALRLVKRTQAQLDAAQKRADEALALARDEGWSFRDIAEAADKAHATVRDRLVRYDAAKAAKQEGSQSDA
jgi:DNA-directed RNA polymerase specialized sigma24 family protein